MNLKPKPLSGRARLPMSTKPNKSNEKRWESVAGRPEAGATYGPQRTTGAEGTTPVLWRGSRPRRPRASPRNHEEERRGGEGGEQGERQGRDR